MKRDIHQIQNNNYDVLIIGGGIHGATLAYETSKNGLKTCLIEKSDFGSETSANSLKVLHGGLRYLQHGNIKRMRESIYSRKIFQQIAPHLVQNIPFLMPTKGFAVKSKLALNIAMKLNDIISFDKNKNILDECNVGRGQTISKKELKNIVPNLNDKAITGGAVWYETVAKNTERLLFEFLHYANDNNAKLSNYIKAVKYNIKNDKIESVEVLDTLNNKKFNIKAKYVVNTVGPWLNEILYATKDYEMLKTPLTKAVNIIVKEELFGKYAVGLESHKEFKDKAAIINKGKRLFFFVPLNGYTMIGTTYKIYKKIKADDCEITKEDIEEILGEVNNSYKGLNLNYQDITQIHVGLQAMPDDEYENDFQVQPETHSLIFDHKNEESILNLISVKSVKYTTAPAIAKRITQKFLSKNFIEEKNNNPNFLFKRKLFFESQNDLNIDLKRIWNLYGSNSQNVIESITRNTETKKIIFEKENIFLGEILYVIENEMAVTAQDVIDRRLGLSAFEKVPRNYYEKVEEIIKLYERRN